MLAAPARPVRPSRRLFKARLITVAAGAVTACAPVALAQAEPEGLDPTVPFLVFEHASLDTILADEKDRAAAEAFAMIPARLRELPAQVPDMDAEAASIVELVLRTLSRPARITAFYNGDNPSGGLFGYGLVVSVDVKDQQEANTLQAQVNTKLAAAAQRFPSKPGQRWATMLDVQLPVGLLSYGPRQVGDDWRYEVILGTVDNPDAAPEAPAFAGVEGLTPFMHGRLDFAGLTGAIAMAQMAAGGQPEAVQTFQWLQEAGLSGPDALKGWFVAGHTADEMVSLSVLEGAAARAEALRLPTEPISAGTFAAVPASATMASLFQTNLDSILNIIDRAVEQSPEAADALEQFRGMTGVDLRHDLLASLGGTAGFYWSDATGGGDLGSSVAMITFRDREKFLAAHSKLMAFANAAADNLPMPGAVQLVPWRDGDVELVSLRFPGLPVPLELTYAATERWLLLAATPQGAMAAARQATGRGDKGLTANPTFASAFPKGKPVLSITYSDTQRHLHRGYTFLSLAGSALSNMVRSPLGAEREPGLVVPMFADLAKGVRPQMEYSYWQGQDLVVESHADRSVLVNLGGMWGSFGQLVPLLMAPAAAAAGQNHAMSEPGTPNVAEMAGMLKAWTPELLLLPRSPMTAAAIAPIGADAAR